MKFYLLPAALLAGAMLTLTSCSSDDAPISRGDDGLTTFSVQLPEDAAATRYGEGVTAKKLFVAITEAGKSEVLFSNFTETDADSAPVDNTNGMEVTDFAVSPTTGKPTATVTVSLVKDKEYDIYCWAQSYTTTDGSTGPYTWDATNKTISISYTDGGAESTTMNAYAEERDAFFAKKADYTSNGGGATIPLYRPFAQINVGTNDVKQFENAGGVGGYGITIENVANVLNLSTGMADQTSVSKDVLVATAAAKENSVTGETAFPVQPATYRYLAMAYVLPCDATTNKASVDVLLNANNDDNFAEYLQVPIQMNYRTNIYGALLTNPEVFQVVIEPSFATPDNNVKITWDGTLKKPVINNETKEITVESPSELAYLANMITTNNYPEGVTSGLEGYIITLPENATFDLQNKEWTPIGNLDGQKPFAGTFDGNGCTIKNLKVANIAPKGKVSAGLFGQVQGTNCVIKNITVENVNLTSECYAGGIVAYSNGNGFTIENCHVKGGSISLNFTKIGNNTWDNADKAGGIIGGVQGGPFIVKNCSVEGVTISGYRGLGGIAGRLSITADSFINNSVSNVTINQDVTHAYQGQIPTTIGVFIGDWSKIPTLQDYLNAGNTYSDVVINAAK